MTKTRVLASAAIVAVIGLFGCSQPSTPEAAPDAPEKSASGSGETTKPRAAWRSQGPDNYSFVLHSRCGERSLIGRFAVSVRHGRVDDVSGLDQLSRASVRSGGASDVPTLDDLIELVRQARADNAYKVVVRFHPQIGYPRRVYIDRHADVIDEEECYRVTGFSAETQE